MVILFKTHFLPFALKWQRGIQEAELQARGTLEASQRYYNTTAHALSDIQVGTSIAVQDHRTKLWDIYRVVTAIGPQRQYHIKTQRGSVLIRNRWHRVPESIPYFKYDREPETVGQNAAEQPRRSTRMKKPTQQLIEDSD